MIERTTSPFPYSALTTIPIALRIMATSIFISVTFACIIWPIFKLIKLGLDSTLGCAETIKAFLTPTSLQVMAIRKQYKTITSLTANVDAQPMVVLDQAKIATQIKEIKARLVILENAPGYSRYPPAHNPAVYSPVRPSAPMV